MTETLSPILPNEIEARAEAVLKRACEQGLTIATAESCTGGLVASVLTDVDGSAHAFERGFVVYSENAKCELLDIRQDDIDRYNAVSREIALAMVEGALRASKADIAVSVTGFAGQGGPDDEPGLVHFGCQRKGRPSVHREEHFGDVGRGAVRIACLDVVLSMLEEAL